MISYSNKLPLEFEFGIDDVELSLVIPAFNEESRLPKTVDHIVSYLSERQPKIKFELIIVNDGSKDNTWKKIEELMKKYNDTDISGVSYQENSGKGYAVTTGMKYARGKYILMLDADGAVPISDYEKLRKEINTEDGVEIMDNGVMIIGQRSQDEETIKVK
jgi:dolichyl-phosphate beta-glucosyltransferase